MTAGVTTSRRCSRSPTMAAAAISLVSYTTYTCTGPGGVAQRSTFPYVSMSLLNNRRSIATGTLVIFKVHPAIGCSDMSE